jgi:predicted nucleotidyltransferase component of viral defense system
MKDHLLQVAVAAPVGERRNLAREYLQIYVLRVLHELGLNARLALVGGTALRIIHALPRFSEDLDFSVATPGPADADILTAAMPSLARELERAGYRVSIRRKHIRAVESAMIRFEGILADCGIVSDERLALSVKLEVDLRPPDGAKTTTTLVQRYFPVAIVHYDLPSLFAGKLHALLARAYVKGRDWYDLVWYLTEKRGLMPNTTLLESALAQTGHDPQLAGHWRDAVAARCAALDWQAVRRDLAPFLLRQSDLEQLTPELIVRLVREG